MGIVILLMLVIITTGEYVSYRNYKVYHVIPSTKEHLELLREFKKNSNIDFWTPLYKSIEPVNIMVSPRFQSQFEKILKQHNIVFTITIEDVERVILEERKTQERAPRVQAGNISFNRYYRYSEIVDYLNELSKLEWVTLQIYGNSYEKRNLTLVEISTGGGNTRPVIFIDGGMHGEEWISVAQVLYIIHRIAEKLESKNITEGMDWVLVPVVNPDGYEHAHKSDRLWRKTRSKGRRCIGVNANHNFAYQWDGPGFDEDECSNDYSGPVPLSEPETKHLVRVLMKYKQRIILYLSFHSPGQSILYPWGFTTQLPRDVFELHHVAFQVERSIASRRGTAYKIGTTYNVHGPLSGCSRDWVYGFLKIVLSYNFHLPSGGGKKVDVPPNKILDIVQETFEGIKEFKAYAIQTATNSKNRLSLTPEIVCIYCYSTLVVFILKCMKILI